MAVDPAPRRSGLSQVVAHHRRLGHLVVQPRMGFGSTQRMRAGLLAVKGAKAHTVGTITLDAYTRTNDHAAAARALRDGSDLNGFPLVAHGADATRMMVSGVADPSFPVQVRHGSALPRSIFETMLAAGLEATEGGPVSYCLPYSRVPLRRAVREWASCCELLAAQPAHGRANHLESFGGCMLGQLCPPALLVALGILEGLFFTAHGLQSISVSYAQQTSFEQDVEAVGALRALAGEYLSAADWHVVVYTYMGVFPLTWAGAMRLLADSARLAVATGAERLIVKTPAEAWRIPTVEENVGSLESAAAASRAAQRRPVQSAADACESETCAVARSIVEAVLGCAPDIGEAIAIAFGKGYLDVPYCLHPDNRNRARSYVDGDGYLRWGDSGSIPLPPEVTSRRDTAVTSSQLLRMLSYNQRRFDQVPGRDPEETGVAFKEEGEVHSRRVPATVRATQGDQP